MQHNLSYWTFIVVVLKWYLLPLLLLRMYSALHIPGTIRIYREEKSMYRRRRRRRRRIAWFHAVIEEFLRLRLV